MLEGFSFGVLIISIVLAIILAGCFAALEKNRKEAVKQAEELSYRLWQATREKTGNEEIIADLASRVSSLERKLTGTNRRVDECWKRWRK